MAEVKIVCIHPALREALQEVGQRLDISEQLALDSAVEGLPACQGNQLFGMEADIPAATEGRGGGGGKKRAASPYNVFVGECLKNRPANVKVQEYMKTCAIEWKTSPKNPKAQQGGR